ncbi:hypothetical protein GW17_00030008 [Ensete ventricosum]|nr:hypothetical protein GW17_00030008 [Ensete ventricosum]
MTEGIRRASGRLMGWEAVGSRGGSIKATAGKERGGQRQGSERWLYASGCDSESLWKRKQGVVGTIATKEQDEEAAGGTVMSGNGEGRSKGKRCGYMAVASTFRATEAAITRSNSDKHQALKRRRRTGN